MNTYYNCPEFRKGYDAASLCESIDKSQSDEWQEGWNSYQDDMTRSEQAQP